MCGISGLVSTDDAVAVRQAAHTLACLNHRGPDASGYLKVGPDGPIVGRGTPLTYDSPFVVLHTRLSIIDLSDGGLQPMSTADGRYWIAYNGEIYNYQEIARELVELGHTFRSHSDTEVLLEAWAEWGPASLSKFVGMFAFVIYDTVKRTITLARDPFGMKPLYYARVNGALAFASEIKALLQLPGISRRANSQRMFDYLRFGITDHGGETMFAAIRQLPQASYATVPLDNPAAGEPIRYWSLEPGKGLGLSVDEAAAELRDLFFESVRLHLRSDVPVGAALSGGIDSSAVVMAMREIEGPGLDIHTFSYVADDATVGEEHWVEMVGAASNATLHKVHLNPSELTDDLDELIMCQDEPFASTSIYAQYRVFKAAREAGITVMLDGQGADELLAGYRPFVAARLASSIRTGHLVSAARLATSATRSPGGSPSRILLQSGGYLMPWQFEKPLRRMVKADLVPNWVNRVWFDRQGVTAATPWMASGPNYLCSALQRSVVETSLPLLLRYEDRNSMAHSVESRLPFLTTKLAEFIISLPEDFLVADDGTSKSVFRKAMHGVVPAPILNRKDKIGFATPERVWLKELTPWVERVLSSDAAREIPVLDMRYVRRGWSEIREQDSYGESPAWRWVNLIKWVDQFDVTFAP